MKYSTQQKKQYTVVSTLVIFSFIFQLIFRMLSFFLPLVFLETYLRPEFLHVSGLLKTQNHQRKLHWLREFQAILVCGGKKALRVKLRRKWGIYPCCLLWLNRAEDVEEEVEDENDPFSLWISVTNYHYLHIHLQCLSWGIETEPIFT